MNVFDGILMGIEKASNENIKANDCDYIKDGILYCGKCNTRKQSRYEINIDGIRRNPPCLCKCETEKRDREEQEEEKKQKQMRTAEIKVRNQSASLRMSNYENVNFDNYRMSNNNKLMFNAAQRYLIQYEREPDLGLIFCGSVGVGKTYTAICIVKELENRGISTIATSFTNILSRDINERDEVIRKILKHKVIMIDDLSAERSTEYAQEIIYKVIDTACKDGKSLIITTNKTRKEMTNTSDVQMQRIYDRILSKCVAIETVGNSLRPQVSKSRQQLFMEGLE